MNLKYFHISPTKALREHQQIERIVKKIDVRAMKRKKQRSAGDEKAVTRIKSHLVLVRSQIPDQAQCTD